MSKILKKWNSLSEPVKSSMVFLLSTVFLKGMIFLTTPIFTRIMSESDMGIIGTYQSWRGVFEAIAIFSIPAGGIFNVGMSQYRDDRDGYMSNMVCFCAVFASISGAFLLFFYDTLESFFMIPRSLIVLMVLYAMIMPAQLFWVARQRYEYKYRAVFCVTIISAICSQVFSVVAVMYSTSRLAESRLWATALVELPFGLFFMFLIISRGRKLFSKLIWKSTLIFTIPLIPHYLSSIVLTASDRIMINALDCSANAGIYTVIHSVGAVTTIIWGAIQASVTPYIYDKLDAKDYSGIDKMAEKTVVGFGIMSMLICLMAPEAVRILGPESYYIGVYAVPPIIGAIFISALYNLFSAVEFYHMKSVFIAFASCVASIFNVVLNYIFIPKYGFVVAGYTTLVSYILLSMMHYFNMRRIEKVDIFNSKRLILISSLLLLLCILPTVLYDKVILRYMVVALIVLVGILKKDIIITLFQRKNN